MNDKDTEFNHLWHRLSEVERGAAFGQVCVRALWRQVRVSIALWLGLRPMRWRSWQFALPEPVVIGL